LEYQALLPAPFGVPASDREKLPKPLEEPSMMKVKEDDEN
jgi:hypothetical protein